MSFIQKECRKTQKGGIAVVFFFFSGGAFGGFPESFLKVLGFKVESLQIGCARIQGTVHGVSPQRDAGISVFALRVQSAALV